MNRLVVLNTTAYGEEDLVILTSLTDEQIESVITPIVNRERNGGSDYNNIELFDALRSAFPNSLLEAIIEDNLSI